MARSVPTDTSTGMEGAGVGEEDEVGVAVGMGEVMAGEGVSSITVTTGTICIEGVEVVVSPLRFVVSPLRCVKGSCFKRTLKLFKHLYLSN